MQDMDFPALQPNTFDGMQNAARIGFKESSYAEFFTKAEFRAHKSSLEGRPIYESVAFIRIIQPGEKDILERPATHEDKMRFPRQWAAFEAKNEQTVDGTPISVLFPHKPDVVSTLQHLRFMTVEQLAGATDTQIQNIGLGGREWVAMAKNYLAMASDGKGSHMMQAEIEKRDAEISRLNDIVEKMQAQLASLTRDDEDGTTGRGRGRPRQGA